MVAIKDALSKLSEVSKQLNEESDSVNEIISMVELAINEANPGLEVWHTWATPNEILASDYHKPEGDGRGFTLFRVFWALGYGRDGRGDWRILARQFEYDKSEEDSSVDPCTEAEPLADCPRDIRVAAAPHLEKLIIRVTEQAERMLDGLREAKAKAE